MNLGPVNHSLISTHICSNPVLRCPSTLTTDGNSYVVPSILKCSDPSDQTACLASLACAYCTDVVVSTTGFTFSSVAGQCGCTSSCNSDNSCSENAILNIQNQCECIFETIAALDESSNEKCQEVSFSLWHGNWGEICYKVKSRLTVTLPTGSTEPMTTK